MILLAAETPRPPDGEDDTRDDAPHSDDVAPVPEASAQSDEPREHPMQRRPQSIADMGEIDPVDEPPTSPRPHGDLPSYPRDPGRSDTERTGTDAPAPALGENLPSYPRQAGPTAEAARRREARPELGADLPSYPREDRTGGSTGGTLVQRLLIGLVAIAAIVLVVLAITSGREDADVHDAMQQVVAAQPRVEMSITTSDPERAQRFVRDEFGWRVGVPSFELAELEGVGIVGIALGVEVPAFLYLDAEGRETVAFALNYALLDQVPDRIRLSPEDYELLAQDTRPRTRRVRGQDVIFWRDRDDIYIAVTEIDSEELAAGLTMTR